MLSLSLQAFHCPLPAVYLDPLAGCQVWKIGHQDCCLFRPIVPPLLAQHDGNISDMAEPNPFGKSPIHPTMSDAGPLLPKAPSKAVSLASADGSQTPSERAHFHSTMSGPRPSPEISILPDRFAEGSPGWSLYRTIPKIDGNVIIPPLKHHYHDTQSYICVNI
jgi:hypothetical protein